LIIVLDLTAAERAFREVYQPGGKPWQANRGWLLLAGLRFGMGPMAPEIPDPEEGTKSDEPRQTSLLFTGDDNQANRLTVAPRSCDGWSKWPLFCSLRIMSKITETGRDHIADEDFAFPKERKEPIHDAAHVRNAIARFKQVQGVTDSERDAAWKRIKSAAKKHKVELNEQDWRELN
jgi:hypothetical protein